MENFSGEVRHVLIGNGVAAVFAAEAIRSMDPAASITMISDEQAPAYSRCLTPDLISGHLTEERLWIRPADFYERLKIQCLFGRRVEKLDPARQAVTLSGGGEIPFDRLLIASGAAPVLSEIPGIHRSGVFGLRTLPDARGIAAIAATARQVVVVGGGLVSLKAAAALRKTGLEVTVVIASDQILSQILDITAAAILQKAIEAAGIRLLFNHDAAEITGAAEASMAVASTAAAHGESRVSGVILDDGTTLPCDLVIVGKGVRPNVAFLTGSGIAVNRGVVTDEFLRAGHPNIFAAGDVAETYDLAWGKPRQNAIWPNAAEQGRIAGHNMTVAAGADSMKRYRGSIGMNSVEFFGVPAISAGITRPPKAIEAKEAVKAKKANEAMGISAIGGAEGDPYQEVITYRPGQGLYHKVVLQGNRVVGMIAVGDIAKAGTLVSLIRGGDRKIAK